MLILQQRPRVASAGQPKRLSHPCSQVSISRSAARTRCSTTFAHGSIRPATLDRLDALGFIRGRSSGARPLLSSLLAGGSSLLAIAPVLLERLRGAAAFRASRRADPPAIAPVSAIRRSLAFARSRAEFLLAVVMRCRGLRQRAISRLHQHAADDLGPFLGLAGLLL